MTWTHAIDRARGLARFLLAWVLCTHAVAIGQPSPEQAAAMQSSIKLRKLTMGIVIYTAEHGDQLPPDLLAIAPYMTGDMTNATGPQRAAAIKDAFLGSDDVNVRVPDALDAEWLSRHAAYSYLPGTGLKASNLEGWDRVAVAHLKFDRALPTEPSSLNPEGELITVSFLDSRVELMPRREAEAVVAESLAVYEAVRKGTPLPDGYQALQNVRVVMQAILAYAAANRGELPPHLGATLEFVPPDPKRRATLADRAKVFLSPRATATTFVPDQPTAEWVNEKTSWLYLGAAGLKHSEIEDPANTILIHGRLDTAVEYSFRSERRLGIPLGTAQGGAKMESEEYARWIEGVSRRVYAWMREGTPLPDHLNAYRDVRLLLDAVFAYAKENGGMLPANLGAASSFLLPGEPVETRARVFLSPMRERVVDIPAEITPEWVNARSSYVYLPPGCVDAKLAWEAGAQLLLHGPMEEPFEVMQPHGINSVIAAGMVFKSTWMTPASAVEKMARESAEVLRELFQATRPDK